MGQRRFNVADVRRDVPPPVAQRPLTGLAIPVAATAIARYGLVRAVAGLLVPGRSYSGQFRGELELACVTVMCVAQRRPRDLVTGARRR